MLLRERQSSGLSVIYNGELSRRMALVLVGTGGAMNRAEELEPEVLVS